MDLQIRALRDLIVVKIHRRGFLNDFYLLAWVGTSRHLQAVKKLVRMLKSFHPRRYYRPVAQRISISHISFLLCDSYCIFSS
jgi:hypothetical protein